MPATPQRGDFVRVRTRRWLVEDERSAGDGLAALRLACVDDDAQGEVVETITWPAEPSCVRMSSFFRTSAWRTTSSSRCS
jgi:hypothetical protein